MDHHQPLLDAGVFESINLASSAVPRGSSQQNSDVLRLRRPDSTSDEDGLDPTEFLSQNRPRGAPKDSETTPNDILARIRSPTIPDHEFFLNPSRILAHEDEKTLQNSLRSTLLQASESLSGPESFNMDAPALTRSQLKESPLEYLQNRQKALVLEARKNIIAHKRALEEQNSPNRLRSMLGQNLEQLSNNYVSLREVYSKNKTSTEELLASFEKWDKKRSKMLTKIQDIKSESNKHGTKLGSLLNERSDVSKEISELEKKLSHLRLKRGLLDTEIEATSSFLESRSAKYVESFRKLEKHGENTIRQYLELNGVPEKEVFVMLKKEKVDVTFTNYYNTQLKRSTPVPETETVKKVSPSSLNMGIQPFIVPEEPVSENEEDLNHDKGPTAYEKGFAKGTRQSSEVKGNVQLFLSKLMAKNEPQNGKKDHPLNVDDSENTITEKINLESVVQHLYHNIEALEALELQTSKKTALFHEHSMIWQDAIKVIKLQEAKLQHQITESLLSSKEENERRFLSILGVTFEHIQSSLKSLPRPIVGEFLVENLAFNVLLNELKASSKALSLVTEDGRFTRVVSEYEKIAFEDLKVSLRTSFHNELLMSKELLEETSLSTWEDRQRSLPPAFTRRISPSPSPKKGSPRISSRAQSTKYSALLSKAVKKE